MLTPSEANKIKKGILAASEVAKCRICRKVIETLRIYRLHYYTDEQVNHFLDLCQKTDFEAATTYYVNTMLAGFKKKEPILYQSDLVSRSADLVMVHDINPNSKDVIDKALSTSNYAGILKALHAYMKKASLSGAIDNILYLIWELARRPKDEAPTSVKHCAFHLLAQFQASRKNGKMTEIYTSDTLIYLQDKYHFFDLSDPKEKAVYQGTVRQNDFKDDWTNYFNSGDVHHAPNITLPLIKQMMSEMDQRHAEEVHYLFVCRYIDYSHYNFRDPWMMDFYLGTYWDFYRTGNYLYELNHFVWNILDEWKKDANHKYQRAKRDLYYWITDPIPEFAPSLGEQIRKAYDEDAGKEKPDHLADALMPFPRLIADIIKAGNYEDAAANIYCLLEHLGAVNKAHEDWFETLWYGGEMTKIALFTETICELYCHLRQQKDLPKDLKNEMDIHLDILNKKTELFGDMWGDSRFEDMLLDGKKQNGDYSDLEDCCIWREWYLPKTLQ